METLRRQPARFGKNPRTVWKSLSCVVVLALPGALVSAGDHTVRSIDDGVRVGSVSAAGTPLGLRRARARLHRLSWTDCGAIQAAIDALPESGGVVTVPPGTFTCATSIVIAKDHVELRGSGPATILLLQDGAEAPVIVIGDLGPEPVVVHRKIRVAGLTVDGNSEHQAYECQAGPCDAERYLRNNGITIRGCEDVVVENVTVRSARSGGLVTEKGCRRVLIRGLTSTENYYDGLAGYETQDSVFTGLHLYDNGAQSGVNAPRGAGLSFDHRFDGNLLSDVVISGSGTVGVFMRDSHDNVFTGMQVVESGQYGVFLAQGDGGVGTAATGNTFQGLTVRKSAWEGFRVNDASCVDNAVLGAQFSGNAGCLSEAVQGQVLAFGTVCR